MEVTLLSDGTGTYSMFGEIGEWDSESYDEFASQKSEFEAILKDYKFFWIISLTFSLISKKSNPLSAFVFDCVLK